KRNRASKPKVRTGCRTCKIRRVKCDEAKPMCQQCQRARVVCDGYHDVGPSTPQLTTIESNSFKPRAKPTNANILSSTVDALLTSSIHLLKGSLSQYRRDTSPIQLNSQARGWMGKEDDLNDIEHMLPFLSIMGGWTPFLKTQRINLALWDTSARGDDAVANLAEYQSTKQLQADWCRFFARASAFTGQAFTAVTQQRPVAVVAAVDLDPALLHEQQKYLSHLDRWRDVLDAALARAATSHDSQANNRAIRLMQLHRLVLSIGMQCCLDPTDMLWDAYDDEFLALVGSCLAFAVEAAATKTTAAGRHYRYYYHARFTFSMGVLSTLGPVIAKCRNHDIRMRALEMARRMPWREGAWDAEAELFGKLGAVLLEERGRNADDGVVWAENRWTWVDGVWDMERRKLVGRYVRSVPDRLTGDHVVTSLEVNLDAWPDVCRDVSCEVDHAAECRVLD
ncbi:hypothetical protein B0T26DRAFT_600108, partial [Lasiosphaeria miniovina]